MSNEYWGFTSDENFDEDGFARGLPQNHPTRAFIALANKLYGESKVKIRKDYTDEFQKHFMDKLPTVTLLSLTTEDPSLKFGNVEFTANVIIKDTRYVYWQTMERRLAETQEQFDRYRIMVFMEIAHALRYKVQALCDHRWESQRNLWVKCAICGLGQDTPQGNRDWTGMFK